MPTVGGNATFSHLTDGIRGLDDLDESKHPEHDVVRDIYGTFESGERKMGSRDRVAQETGCVVDQQRWKDDGKKKKERDRG